MDSYLTTELLRALSEGNLTKFVAYGAVFMFLWVEVRGLKTEMVKLNKTISETFLGNESRFTKLENKQQIQEDRITALEIMGREQNEVSI